MSLVLKPGVDLSYLTPQMLLGLIIADQVYAGHGHSCRVTSVFRRNAMLHTTGKAADLGIRDLNGEVYPDTVIDNILGDLRSRLGKQHGGAFDVVDERTALGGPHIHLEYDPK